MTPLKNIFKKPHGFTLVELIVSITILTILSSIGFVTMTGYFAGTRDSARITDMNSIYGQLDLIFWSNGILPLPENYRIITMSGTTIAYQGYAGKTVLDTIKFNGWGRDPKDNTYYTYTTNTKRSQAQLMGYFEEYDTTKLSNLTKLLPKATAASLLDYSDRKIGIIGKKICMLTESGTLVPVQDSSTGTLDIATTNTGYTVYCDNSIKGSGTGSVLGSIFLNNSSAYVAPQPVTSTATCTSTGQIGTGTTTYTGCNTADIVVCTGAGTGQIWSACNAGATIVWTNQTFTSSTGARDATINSWAGGLYQWGNNADISYAGTSGQIACTNTPNWSNTTVFRDGAGGDWCFIPSDNLWWDTTNTSIARQWPCATNYHVPAQSEWVSAINAITSKTSGWVTWDVTVLQNTMKLPMSGSRDYQIGSMKMQGAYGHYHSSSPNSNSANAYNLVFSSTNIYLGYLNNRAYGTSVRCIKN